jgi:hypothetical protein
MRAPFACRRSEADSDRMRSKFRLGLIGLGGAFIALYLVSYFTTGGHPFQTTSSQPSTATISPADLVKPAALVKASAKAAGERVVGVSCGQSCSIAPL